MGWLWGTSEPSPPPPRSPDRDPLRDLDPSLRSFLETESPSKYTPPLPPPPSDPLLPSSSSSSTPTAASLPTLYLDGRFAHLWSTYRPQGQVEAEAKTDQEKLMDVLDGYKQRKATIARAALENCAVEQEGINECYEKGSWMRRMGLCREESRAFERCYLMQSRFLKALGYLSNTQRSPAIDEEIQMHADTLYHRMLTQEAAIAAAKAASEPIPTFPPILSRAPPQQQKQPRSHLPDHALSPSVPSPPHPQKDVLTPSARAVLNKRLATMTPEERAIEEQAVMMEAKQEVQVGRNVTEIRDEQGRKRQERREKGRATAGDTISGWFGW